MSQDNDFNSLNQDLNNFKEITNKFQEYLLLEIESKSDEHYQFFSKQKEELYSFLEKNYSKIDQMININEKCDELKQTATEQDESIGLLQNEMNTNIIEINDIILENKLLIKQLNEKISLYNTDFNLDDLSNSNDIKSLIEQYENKISYLIDNLIKMRKDYDVEIESLNKNLDAKNEDYKKLLIENNELKKLNMNENKFKLFDAKLGLLKKEVDEKNNNLKLLKEEIAVLKEIIVEKDKTIELLKEK